MNERTTLVGWIADAVEGRDISWSVAILRPLASWLTILFAQSSYHPFGENADEIVLGAFSALSVFGLALAIKASKTFEIWVYPGLRGWSFLLFVLNRGARKKLVELFATNGVFKQIYSVQWDPNRDAAVTSLIQSGTLVTCSPRDVVTEEDGRQIYLQEVFVREDIRKFLHLRAHSLNTFQPDTAVLAAYFGK